MAGFFAGAETEGRAAMQRSEFESWKPIDVARLLALVESGRRYFQELLARLVDEVRSLAAG